MRPPICRLQPVANDFLARRKIKPDFTAFQNSQCSLAAKSGTGLQSASVGALARHRFGNTAPAAIVIIGDLVSATVLTLIVLPALYLFVNRNNDEAKTLAAPVK